MLQTSHQSASARLSARKRCIYSEGDLIKRTSKRKAHISVVANDHHLCRVRLTVPLLSARKGDTLTHRISQWKTGQHWWWPASGPIYTGQYPSTLSLPVLEGKHPPSLKAPSLHTINQITFEWMAIWNYIETSLYSAGNSPCSNKPCFTCDRWADWNRATTRACLTYAAAACKSSIYMYPIKYNYNYVVVYG